MNVDRIDRADYIDELSSRNSARYVRVGQMRASDADRAASAALLRRHYVAGRLDAPEFEERVGRCYAARTLAELNELVADLQLHEVQEMTTDRARDGRRPVGTLVMTVPLVVVLAAIAGLTGIHVVWLVWPLAFFALRTGLWHGWQGGW